MRLSTIVWFAAGCGLALATVAGGRMVRDALRGQASFTTVEQAGLSSMTPTAASEHTEHKVFPPTVNPWTNVPIQRPRIVRDAPGPCAVEEWKPSEAQLPSIDATAHWNPDDARIPDGAAVIATRAYWNPNSAELPRPHRSVHVAWDPNDARLPAS